MHEAELPTETLISIIDDDEDFHEAIARLMKSRGFTVDASPSALAFLSCPNIRNTSCLIVDAHMPRMTGIELHRRLVERGRKSRLHGLQGFGAKSSGRDGFRTTMCK